jgi:putative urate catabolism protein
LPDQAYPRDLVGYGRNPPHPRWPGEARVCVQIVINYEEGGENNILHGDPASEAFLSEIVGAAPWLGQRHMNMESIYEYGSRAGFWRLWRLFTERNLPVTVFGVATALARNAEAVAAMKEAGWEIASHGLKWVDYKDFSAEEERAHLREALRIHEDITGYRPLGWYTGRTSEHTLRLVQEEGGFLYSADSYADDLPYWTAGETGRLPVVPYTLDANDMRFATPQGFNAGDQFYAYLKDSFDVLYREGEIAPKMMSVGLHCRLVGRPGRAAALARFLDHIAAHEDVWSRAGSRWRDIGSATIVPRTCAQAAWVARCSRSFSATFSSILPGSGGGSCRWPVPGPGQRRGAARRHGPPRSTPPRASGRWRLSRLIRSRRPAQARGAHVRLRDGASLGRAGQPLDEERRRFLALNERYRAKFGFPFIMAVKGRGKAEILAAFERRLEHDADEEFATALAEVKTIALLRLKERLPSVPGAVVPIA